MVLPQPPPAGRRVLGPLATGRGGRQPGPAAAPRAVSFAAGATTTGGRPCHLRAAPGYTAPLLRRDTSDLSRGSLWSAGCIAPAHSADLAREPAPWHHPGSESSVDAPTVSDLSPSRSGTVDDAAVGIAAHTEEDREFCPKLVVPADCECVLFVPRAARASRYRVFDADGNDVLWIEGGGRSWQWDLRTTSGELLASCKRGPGPLECRLCYTSGGDYAMLCPEPGGEGFLLTSTSRRTLRFGGSLQIAALSVTDESGTLIATTELASPSEVPQSCGGTEFYRLRVGPSVDVAVIICSLLFIECS